MISNDRASSSLAVGTKFKNMSTLETQYRKYLETNPESKLTFDEWKEQLFNSIERAINWWEKPENKTTIEIPVSMIQEADGSWVIGSNKETEDLLGNHLSSIVDSGKTREIAIKKFFEVMRFLHEYSVDRKMSYSRWVPLKVGPWKKGGRWVEIFGIMISFRYGDSMKGGWYVPFTKLNISVYNGWVNYRKFSPLKRDLKK